MRKKALILTLVQIVSIIIGVVGCILLFLGIVYLFIKIPLWFIDLFGIVVDITDEFTLMNVYVGEVCILFLVILGICGIVHLYRYNLVELKEENNE